MNRVSAFGNLNQAGAKRIARREKTIATKNKSQNLLMIQINDKNLLIIENNMKNDYNITISFKKRILQALHGEMVVDTGGGGGK